LELDAENLDAARAYISEATKLAPDDSAVYLLRGLTEDDADKRQLFREARRRDPTSARAHYEFARTFLGGGATEDALDAAISAMFLSAETTAAPILVGELALDLGYFDDARSVLQPIANWAFDEKERAAARALLERIPGK
jgi:thioredoxin-like negative regulator of GroEL